MKSECATSSPSSSGKRRDSFNPTLLNEALMASASNLFQSMNKVVHSSVSSVNSAARSGASVVQSSVSGVNSVARSGVSVASSSVNKVVQSSVSSVNSAARSGVSVASSTVNMVSSFSRKKGSSQPIISPAAKDAIRSYSERALGDNKEQDLRRSSSMLLDAETFIANRYMCNRAETCPVNSLLLEEYNLILSVAKFRGPLFLSSGVDVSYALTGEPFEGGTKLSLNNNMHLENKKGYTVAMCFGELRNGGLLLCGSNAILASDIPVEKYFTKRFFPWLKIRLDDSSLCIDVWNGKEYVPLWKAADVIKNATITVFSLRNNASVARLAPTSTCTWNLRSKLGLDPALFICLAGIIIGLKSEQSNRRTAVMTEKAKRAFRVVKGVVEMPFKTLINNRDGGNFIATDGIWVGPNTIIQYRCLCKKYEALLKQTSSYELAFIANDKGTCFQANQSIQVKDCNTGELFVGGSVVKLGPESFGLKDSVGTPVALCLIEDVNRTSLICGGSPLFPTDKPNGYGGKMPYYPWLKFQIDENEMVVDLWTGLSFTPLWYAENIPLNGALNVICAENDDQIVGQIYSEGIVKLNSGIDPSMFICLGVLVMKFNETRYKKRDHRGSIRSSHLFKVVNGEVLAPFQSSSTSGIDNDDEENLLEKVSTPAGADGIWVGPDEVIKNRFLSMYQKKAQNLGHCEQHKIQLAYPAGEQEFATNESQSTVRYSETDSQNENLASVQWGIEAFTILDGQGRKIAKCMEDLTNLVSIVCGTCPLFSSDDPIEEDEEQSFYRWFQVALDDDELLIDMWSGLLFTPLWYSDRIMKDETFDIVSAESDAKVATLSLWPSGNVMSQNDFDPIIFVCVNGIASRLVAQHKEKTLERN